MLIFTLNLEREWKIVGMNSLESEHLNSVKQTIKKEALSLLEFEKNLTSNVDEVVEEILKCKGRLIVTGVGKSGIIGRKMVATFASTGTPSLFLHPAEGLHGDLGMVTSSDIVMSLSKSGESEEVIQLLPSIKRIGAKNICIVANENSTLAKQSDFVLSIGDFEEACPLGLAPTTSTTIMLALGDALAIALLNARNFKPEHFAIFHPGGLLGKKLLMSVADIIELSPKNPVVSRKDDIAKVIFEMTESGTGAVSVINDQNVLIGILTDGDIRRALYTNQNILNTRVEELCSLTPTVISKDSLAVEALNIMEQCSINALPVVDDNGEPISMILIHDLTRIGL